MSRGRGRSWRPDKKSGGRDARRRTAMFLIVALVVLIGALLIPLLRSNPVVRIAFMVPEVSADSSPLFTVDRSETIRRGAEQLRQLLQDLHERNPVKVGDVSSISTIEDIVATAKPGEKLFLYCGYEPITAVGDSGEPELHLLTGKGSQTITFPEMLSMLKKLQASQIILVMDFLQRDTGIANGRLSNDVISLIDSHVATAKMRELAVISPCRADQHNWEPTSFSVQKPSTTDETTSEIRALAAGTVLTNAVSQSFADSQFTSLDQLFKSVSENVADSVDTQYGQVQSVQLHPKQPDLIDADFLSRVQAPSLEDDKPDDATDEKQPAEENKPAPTADESKEQKPTAENDFADLIERRSKLEASGEAIATDPFKWAELTVALATARWSLIHTGDGDQFRQDLIRATTLIDGIESSLTQVTAATSDVSFAPWLSPPITGEVISDEVFSKAFADGTNEQLSSRLPSDLRLKDGRAQFAQWIIQEVSKLGGTLTDKEQASKRLNEWQRFMAHINDAGWNQSEWPAPLLTIDEILSQPAGTQPIQKLKALADLLRLRQRGLECATGTFQDGGRFRQSVWNASRNDIQKLLIDLTAAERWLALGDDGLRKCQEKLNAAETLWKAVNKELNAQHKISTLPDRQQTDLAFLIQFLAQQQEEVEINDEELAGAIAVADQILQEETVTALQFSPGVYAAAELDSEQVQAMFQLTRDFSRLQAVEADLNHQQTLESYVAQRIANGRDGNESRRLISLIRSPKSTADCLAQLKRPSATAGQSSRRRTGLRLASWSIRLLDATSNKVHQNLWKQWRSLAQELLNQNPDLVLAARTKLADQLSSEWSNLRSETRKATATDLFVTQEMAARLLAADLAERINARTDNQKLYTRAFQSLPNTSKADVSADSNKLPNAQIQIGKENRALLPVNTAADRMYVSERAFRPEGMALQSGWYRLDDPEQGAQVRISPTNPGGASQVLKVVFANEHDVVFASQDVTVLPNADAAFKISLTDVNGQSVFLLDGTRLRLPPSTGTPKDVPLPLNVNLTKIKGATFANVDLFAIQIDGKETALGSRRLDFTNSKTVQVPFQKPAPTEANTGSGNDLSIQSNATVDVRGGIRLEVTPEIQGATTTSFTILPQIADATAYVPQPELPRFDATNLRLTIDVRKIRNVATLAPKTIPVEIHFDSQLSEMLDRSKSSPLKIKDITESGSTLTFFFSNELASYDGFDDLEFSLTVASIPHVWRWKLEDDEATLVAPEQAEVRADLTVLDQGKKVARDNNGNPLLSDKTANAQLDLQMHIYGGQFDDRVTMEPKYELSLEIAPQGRNSQPTRISEVIDVYSRRSESIQVSAGKKGAWNFSTQTSSYQESGLKIQGPDSLGLAAGKYDLIATLKSVKTGRSNQDQQQFTFDNTPPEFAQSIIEGETTFQAGKTVVGRVLVEDEESGIAEIFVGFDETDLVKVDPSGTFRLPANTPGIPQLTAKEQSQSEVRSLIVTAVNSVGLKSTEKIRITFERKAMKASARPKATGSVEFTFKGPGTRTARLKDGNNTTVKELKGNSPILFTDVPVGSYKIFWKTGFAAESGTTAGFAVKNGETTTVNVP